MDALPPLATIAFDQTRAPTAAVICIKKPNTLESEVQGIRIEKTCTAVVGKPLDNRVKLYVIKRHELPVATETIHSLLYRYFQTKDTFTPKEGIRLLQYGCKPKSRRIDFRHR